MTDTPTAVSEASSALLNLEMLAGLFAVRDELGDFFEGATFKRSDSEGREAIAPLFSDSALGMLAPIGWALATLAGSQSRQEFVEKAPGDAWRNAAALMGATVDFVQGFLARWRGGVLGETTAEVFTAGVVGPVSTFKAKRIRRECLLDDTGMGRLETLQVEGEACELLVFDALLADMLEELQNEPMATHVRKTPPKKRGQRWTGNTPKACMLVFEFVWAKLERERAAPVFKLMHVEHLGSSYVQAPKVLGGIAWAFGTDGQRVVDGDEYRAAPKVARYVSRSIGLVPEGRLKQGLLAVETTTEALAVRVLADSQAVISGVGGKVALLLAVLSPEGSGLCRMTVDELCRMLWPAAKRGPQLRDRQAAVKAALALRELFVVLPNTVNFRLWDISAPAAKAPTGDLPITFGWSKNAEAEELGGLAAGMLRGRFLLNLSGAMRLSADHALELRTYLHAAAGWNEARRGEVFEPKFAPMGTAEEIAARVNALSAPALQYLSEQGKGRRQAAADDKRRLTEALERLADEAGLIRLEKGGRGVLRLLPPGGLLEAYELMRKDGRRPVK